MCPCWSIRFWDQPEPLPSLYYTIKKWHVFSLDLKLVIFYVKKEVPAYNRTHLEPFLQHISITSQWTPGTSQQKLVTSDLIAPSSQCPLDMDFAQCFCSLSLPRILSFCKQLWYHCYTKPCWEKMAKYCNLWVSEKGPRIALQSH